MDVKILNTIGLIFNIVGVLILFFYGFPQPTHESGVALGLEDNTPLADGGTVADYNKKAETTKKKYLNKSRLALGMIVIGFIFQLCATWRS